MKRGRQPYLWRSLPLILILAAPPLASARGAGEFGWLKPGKDSNFNWMEFHEVAEAAATTKKPVLIYFYIGEKTIENAGPMIDAQMRLFPDERVRGATAGFLCTKVDLTNPEAVERAIAGDARKAALAERRERRKNRGRKGAGGQDGEPGAEDGGGEEPAPDEEESPADAPPMLILQVDRWPGDVAIYLLDYQGRPIEQITKVSSNSRNFISTLSKAKATNEKRIKADEKAAEKEAKRLEKEEAERAEEAERRAREEAKKQESDKPDSGNDRGVDEDR